MRSLPVPLLGLLVMAAPLSQPAQASGPFPFETPFFDERNLEDLLAGNLTDRYSRRNLAPLISYLHLTGKFTASHAFLFREQEREREREAQGRWPRPNVEFDNLLESEGYPRHWFSVWKSIRRDYVENGRAFTRHYGIENCLPDAFRVAAKTFRERKFWYGSGSLRLKRWIEAQIRVFEHCGNDGFDPPPEPQDDWELLEKHDRQYQIAASYFYDGQYREAARRFREIGSTTDSPWSGLGRYLVGRSLAREANVDEENRRELLDQALAEYRQLAQDRDFVRRFPWITQQVEFIQAKVDPATALNRIEQKIIHDPDYVSQQEIRDYVFLIASHEPQRRDGSTYGDWYYLAKTGNRRETITRWRERQSLEWLFLALINAGSSSGEETLADLLEAAAEFGPETPGYYVMLNHRVRITAELGDVDGALALAENPYNGTKPLSRRHINRVRFRAANLSVRWEDYFRFASISPLELPWRYGTVNRNTTLFPQEATDLINIYFTPAMMLEAIGLEGLSRHQRSRMAISGWTKAILLGDSGLARELSSEVKRYVPRLKTAFEKYESGRDPEFEAALIVLGNPAFSPNMWPGAGRVERKYQSELLVLDNVALPWSYYNWWCPASWAREQNEAVFSRPRFAGYDEAQLDKIRELRQIGQVSVAGFFGPAVLRYARSNREDPRTPYALHRLVFATRHACMGGPGEISRQAHHFLHRHFPESEWTEKTPYWYD